MITEQDKKILSTLQHHGRMPMVELAAKTNMSESTCLRRTKSLEEIGVIKGYAALLDAEKAGFDVMAFVQVSINQNTEAAFDIFKTAVRASRSEEHTSELQSPYVISYAVFCLKKKKEKQKNDKK